MISNAQIRRTIIYICMISIGLAFSGCVTYYLEPSDLRENQELIYVDGYPAVADAVLTSKDEGLVVKLYGYTTSEVLVLEMYYGNATSEAINVIPDEITATGSSSQKTKALKVWEANEYIRRAKTIQTTALALQAISGALEATNAGHSSSYSSGTYSGSTSNSRYSGRYSGWTSSYDSSKVAEASARNAAAIRQQAEDNQNNIEYLEAVLLKRTTLQPGYYMVGAVYIERGIFDNYHVTVPFGDHLFEFSFNTSEVTY